MQKTRMLTVAVAATAALGLAACGSDDKKDTSSSASTPTTSTPTSTGGSSAFTTQANATCSQFQSRLNTIQKRAQSATAANRASILNDTADLLDELNTKLKSITPPPDKKAQYDQLVKAFEDVATDYRAGAKAFESGDDTTGRTKTQAGVTASAEGVRVATQLQLPACGAGGGTG